MYELVALEEKKKKVGKVFVFRGGGVGYGRSGRVSLNCMCFSGGAWGSWGGLRDFLPGVFDVCHSCRKVFKPTCSLSCGLYGHHCGGDNAY